MNTTADEPRSLPPHAVIAATDFSVGADLAVQRAARLAREQACPLALLHVLSQDWLSTLQQWLGNRPPVEHLIADVQAALQREADALVAEVPQGVHACVVAGHPVQTLARWAGEGAARCLVLGARGQGGVQRLLLGTTAERLLRKAQCPVLVVRQSAAQPYQRVLVPVDFSPWSAPTLALVDTMAPHALVELLHVYTVPFEEKLRFAGVDDDTIAHYRERTRAQAHARLLALAHEQGWSPSRYRVHLYEGDAAPAVVRSAQEWGCDLVALGKHGQGVAEELLLGSVTKHVVAEASCDVLVSPAAQRV